MRLWQAAIAFIIVCLSVDALTGDWSQLLRSVATVAVGGFAGVILRQLFGTTIEEFARRKLW